MSKQISLTRQQLAKFLPSPEAIREFEKLFGQNADVITTVENIIIAAGLANDGSYNTRSGTNYLDGSVSLYEDGTRLDDALLELITITAIDKILDPTQQTVLVNASTGIVNITMPSPIDCINNNRSFRFAIHKIDSSTNAVNILPSAGELIMNEATQSLLYEAEILNFITDGTNWYLGA